MRPSRAQILPCPRSAIGTGEPGCIQPREVDHGDSLRYSDINQKDEPFADCLWIFVDHNQTKISHPSMPLLRELSRTVGSLIIEEMHLPDCS